MNFIRKIFEFLIKHWKFTAPITGALIGLFIYLFFFVFAFHLMWIDNKVDEEERVFASGATAQQSTTGVTEPDSSITGVTEPDIAGAPVPLPPASAAVVRESAPAEFYDLNNHDTKSGVAFIRTDGIEIFLRIEDLDTSNGPDLNVYLTGNDDPKRANRDGNYVDLGNLKGNIGNSSYVVPPDTDLDEYSTVVVWCVRFSVAFAAAELNPVPS